MTGAGAVLVIVAYALRESLRRRVFLVVLVLTLGFLALYGVGTYFAFRDVKSFAPPDKNILDPTAFTGATVLGLAMFATLFLGAVVAIFLTLGVVRGDAEAGLLQPIVVRPIGRQTIVLARLAGAAAVAAAYVLVVYAIALAITVAVVGSPTTWWGRRSGWRSRWSRSRRSPSWHRSSCRRLRRESPSSWSSVPASPPGFWTRSGAP
jgi:Cu-processing system permease protein